MANIAPIMNNILFTRIVAQKDTSSDCAALRLLFTTTIYTTMARLILLDSSVQSKRLFRALLIKPLRNSVLIVVRLILESDIIEVQATTDKNHPIISGCFDEKKTVPFEIYSIISVRGETAPLALLNGAQDFFALGWSIATDGALKSDADNSDGLISAAESGLALSAPIEMAGRDHVTQWADGEEIAEIQD